MAVVTLSRALGQVPLAASLRVGLLLLGFEVERLSGKGKSLKAAFLRTVQHLRSSLGSSIETW